MSLRVVPLELREANALVRTWHRHLPEETGHRYSLGAVKDGVLVGAAIVGRPTSKECPIREVIEITRCVTNGTRNACSLLYGAAARMAKAHGYFKIQTYNLNEEGGESLRAAGFVRVADVKGRPHVRSDGAPRRNANTDDKGRWERILNPPLPLFVFDPDVTEGVPQLSFEVSA